MTQAEDRLVLAVDGGGTRCRLALATSEKTALVELGSANVSTDFDAALATIRQGLRGLAARTGLTPEVIATLPAVVGVAGVTGPEISARLEKGLGLSCAKVMDDRPAALRGALGARDGVVAHCGTGSFFGARLGAQMTFSGGWGPVLGDEASAQWVGRRALGLTLRCVDGRTAASPLTRRLLEDLEGASGIVRFAADASPADLGSLAPLVTESATRGDALARSILQEGAQDIAQSVRQLGWHANLALCLTGGIGPHFAAYLPEDLQAALQPAEGDPLSGAIALAREFARDLPGNRHGKRGGCPA